MTYFSKTAVFLTLGIALSLTACKPKLAAPDIAPKPEAAAAAAPVPAPVAAPTTTPAPTAAPAAVHAQPGASAVADLDKIALVTKPLPPFPFIDYPPHLHKALQYTDESDFDQLAVVVGDKLHMVEGRFRAIRFSLGDAKISAFQAKRDYTRAALDMGGVKVNTVLPKSDAFYAANGLDGTSDDADKARFDLNKKTKYESNHTYDAYFFPTASGRKWLVLMFGDSDMRVLSIEEKTTGSSVKLVAAAAIESELDTKGHIALYINFDTDKAILRTEGKAAVDEIATLMKKDSTLKLSIEGHTDNVGEARRNVVLSRERAQAVVDALVKDGIGSARLSAVGHGAAKPVADNGSDEGRAKNRRVELVKVKG